MTTPPWWRKSWYIIIIIVVSLFLEFTWSYPANDQGAEISNHCCDFGDMSTKPVVGNATQAVAVPWRVYQPNYRIYEDSESDRRKPILPILISPNTTAPLCSAGTDDRFDKLELIVQKLTAAMDPKVAQHIENSRNVICDNWRQTPETGSYPYRASPSKQNKVHAPSWGNPMLANERINLPGHQLWTRKREITSLLMSLWWLLMPSHDFTPFDSTWKIREKRTHMLYGMKLL